MYAVCTFIVFGCQPENDTWGIEWQFVNSGTLAVQKCSGLSESSGAICGAQFTSYGLFNCTSCNLTNL